MLETGSVGNGVAWPMLSTYLRVFLGRLHAHIRAGTRQVSRVPNVFFPDHENDEFGKNRDVVTNMLQRCGLLGYRLHLEHRKSLSRKSEGEGNLG